MATILEHPISAESQQLTSLSSLLVDSDGYLIVHLGKMSSREEYLIIIVAAGVFDCLRFS